MSLYLDAIKKISLLAGPMVLVRILFVLVNVIGMILISRMGHVQAAAGALITAILNMLMVIAMSTTIPVGIIGGRFFGAKAYAKIGELFRCSSLISLLITAFVCLFLWHSAFILRLFNEPESLIGHISAYFRAFSFGVLPALLIVNLHQLCFSTKKQKLVLIWTIISFMLNMVLGPILMYGFLGFPKLGMNGWAFAISATNWIMLTGILLYVLQNRDFNPLQLWTKTQIFRLSHFKKLSQIGIPITVQISGELILFAVFNLMIGWLGIEALTAQQIIIQTTVLTLMIPMGVSQASAILISQSIGQKKPDHIKYICISGFLMVVFFMLIVGTFYLVSPGLIIKIFLSQALITPALISLVSTNLVIAAFSQLADACRNVQIGFLRGLHDTSWPMIVNVLLLTASIPVSYFLGIIQKYGLVGFNIGYMCAFLLGAGLMLVRLFHKVKNQHFNHEKK